MVSQGWRTSMEDAHCAELDVDGQGSAFFGVYDGLSPVLCLKDFHRPQTIFKPSAASMVDYGIEEREKTYPTFLQGMPVPMLRSIPAATCTRTA